MTRYSFIASGEIRHIIETKCKNGKIKCYLFCIYDFRAHENYTYSRYKGIYCILKRIKNSLWGTITYFVKKKKKKHNKSLTEML